MGYLRLLYINEGDEKLKKEYTDNKKKKKILFYNILIIISVIVLLISGYFLLKILVIDPRKNENTIDEIQKIYYSNDSEADVSFNLENLLQINSDIKGWIKIENTPIDYPVLYSDFYLYHNYKKEYSKYGSIFIDSICNIDTNPKNVLLHGHHMNNGSMFAYICKFADLSFYKSTPVFNFDTIKSKNKWKIISVFKTNTNPEHGELFPYLTSNFKSKDSFLEYIYKVKIRSIIDTPVDVNENDELITLSTCSYELKDFRTVVVARKVRDGEDISVDVAQAKYNPSPLYPDAYYSKYGGAKPDVTSFKESLKAGKLSWYKNTN